jgi:hypothetical protein
MRRALRRLAQGVVKTERRTRETETPTLKTKKVAVRKPCMVMARWNRSVCHKVTIGSPGVKVLNKAGKATRPVKRGIKSQTRLMKRPRGIRERQARSRLKKYSAKMMRSRWERLTAKSKAKKVITFTRGSRFCRRPSFLANSSEKMAFSRVVVISEMLRSIKPRLPRITPPKAIYLYSSDLG